MQASLDYGVSGNGARTAEIKAEISPAGAGTWSDFDLGSATGTAAQGLASIYELGHVDYTDEAAGLSAGSYDVRLSAGLDAAGLTVSFIGSVYFNVA